MLGPEHADMLTAMHNLGGTLRREGRWVEAEKEQRETLALRRKVIGPENPETLKTVGELALTLSYEKKFDEARKLYAERIEILGRTQGKAEAAAARYDFACGAAVAGFSEEAFDHLKQAIDGGFSEFGQMRTNEQLKSLRGDPRFEALVAAMQQRTAASATKSN